ncbi:MAG: DUF721 domain-containing protein [Deltaproteobacteria bacterium]|jgi:hypothetical protein|nr:DUF721 domain-containing protein [Deltaproteobacteria bacterium]
MSDKDQKRFSPAPLSVDRLMARSSMKGFFYFISNRARLTEIWQKTVGPQVAQNAFIRSFEIGRLEVAVKGPAYLERYRYFIREWKKRLNIEFGDEVVTEICLRVGSKEDEDADQPWPR